MMRRFLWLLVLVHGGQFGRALGDSTALYPQATETRQVQSLDGVWNFRLSGGSLGDGFRDRWFEQNLNRLDAHYERMPVPSSFNDITEKREIRDFVGWVWYDRQFFVPGNWKNGNIRLWFGSVNYLASVYVNGKFALNHTGGHLPFETDVTSLVKLDSENHISVAVNNVLSSITLPPGRTSTKNDSRKAGTFTETFPNFDFFNYAGIHRSVLLSFVPNVRITDLTLVTGVLADQTTGTVQFDIKTNSLTANKRKSELTFEIILRDADGKTVAKGSTSSGTLKVPNANLWFPFTMSSQSAYLYRLNVRIRQGGQLLDSWYQKVGIRSVALVGNELLVNGRPIYLRGFGRHEDENIRGRSLDQATILKDFNLMKWMGANSFRTSHYPYAEAIMNEADEQGFIVIDELPAVGLQQFTPELLKQHLQTVRELIQRDKNRPSVFLWSLANEPSSDKLEAGPYFEKVAALARSLDPSRRPLTAAISAPVAFEQMAPSLDVLMINRYFGWYSDTGFPQVIQGAVVSEYTKFYEKFQKPVMISEYGADTVVGMHTEPSFIFSEDYQLELLIENHKAFDILRSKGFFIGEHIWNFADFMTGQDVNRVGGNKKGIFTRDRQPKSAARLLRCRYWRLSGDRDNQHRQGFSLCPDTVY